ncbi:MAG: Stk1 family PASTA domain-containing Ser/Thr kinase [Gaiellaceae bacterium]
MATSDSMTGTIFAGRYRLERKLGSGGMADVWLAEDQELGRRVAVKILHERYANDEQFVERFRREATHAAGLSHQNIVSIYDRGSADGSYFIVMEYVEGRTLKELLVNRGPCPVPVAIAYARQILGALRYAHRNGIIHRDIKPHNVIVDREGRIQVADFGIARAGASSQMTEAGSIIGTAQYLSPEQARGAPVDESSDLYSTGIVLYELLTGVVPFTGETAVEIAMKHLSHIPAAPSTIRPEIPHDLDLVVLRALAKDPEDRYRSASDMDRDLELVARGEGVGPETEDAATTVLAGASAPTTVTRAGAARPQVAGSDGRYRAYDSDVRRSRSPWPWALVALVVATALGVGGWFLYDKVQRQIDNSKPLAVGLYTGIHLAQSQALVRKDGFEPRVDRVANADVPIGDVFEQDPTEGTKLPRGDIVVLKVSTGKPKVPVPDVVGKSRDDAIAILVKAGLEPNPQPVPSNQPADIVVAQDPHGGVVVVDGSRVRINISKGPKQVVLPSVIGLLYDQASAQLQAAGFGVKRNDVDSTEPANTVIDQAPTGNALVTQGTTITLTVSKGPPTVQVPDVINQDADTAKATLVAAGFKVKVLPTDTQDATQDNRVVAQDPAGLTDAKPGIVVTITVAHLSVSPPTTPDHTTTATTATTTATTTP